MRLRRDGSLDANGHTVRARHIVVATNAAAAAWRPVRGRMTVFGSYAVMTEPVPDLLAEIGWTGDEGICDARMFLHYFRTTEDGRVLMGSGSGPIGYGARIDERFTHDAATAARAELGLRRLLPALARRGSRRAGAGRSTSPPTTSRSSAPSPAARVHYALGYSGHGVGPSWLAGQVLASLVPRRRGRVDAPCRSSAAGWRRCRPSRSAGSAAVRFARRSSPARRPRRRAGGRHWPRGRPPPCPASCECGSVSAETPAQFAADIDVD